MRQISLWIPGLTAVFLLTAGTVHAQMGMMGNYNNNSSSSEFQTLQKTLSDTTNQVMSSQHVSAINQLNCSKVSSDQFEKVGDAWMGVMAGSESSHTQMEQMMGGEGSQSLQQAHIQMGERYLGCSLTGNQNNVMQMGGGVFSMMGGYGWNMMGGNYSWFGIGAFLFWAVAFIDLILLGVFLWKRIKK